MSFFPLDVLDGIWDLIESVSEGFLAYSCTIQMHKIFENLLLQNHLPQVFVTKYVALTTCLLK